MAVGENPKESKPQAGTTRQQDMNRRDQQRNPGTSTTPARPNPGGVQDTEMVRLGLQGTGGLESPGDSHLRLLPWAWPSLPSQSWEPGWWGQQVLQQSYPFLQGPCRRHLDSVLQQLQTEIYRGAHTLYVPNCDHRGFYRKRQVRPFLSSLGLSVQGSY